MMGSRWIIAALAPLAFVACGGALASGDRDASGLIGRSAPEFRVAPVAGAGAAGRAPIALGGLTGHVVLVDFWGSYCRPCRRSFPHLQELSAKYAPDGLRVVGISEDEHDGGRIAAFARAAGATFAIGWDRDGSIARAYGPDGLPTSFLIDRSGVVRYAHTGYLPGDELEIEKEVKELLFSAM